MTPRWKICVQTNNICHIFHHIFRDITVCGSGMSSFSGSGNFRGNLFFSLRRFEMLVVTLPVFLHLIASLSAYSSQLAAPQTGKEQQKTLADVSQLKKLDQTEPGRKSRAIKLHL